MSESQADRTQKIRMLPFIIRKDSIRSQNYSNNGVMFHCLKGSTGNILLKEDLIYKSVEGDFLKGKYPNLVIKNELNILKNSSETTATYTTPDSTIELTSNRIVNIIGQENYDRVLTALCSVINQELKVTAILALLCKQNPKSCSSATQTYESSYDIFVRDKLKKRRRTRITSYVIQDNVKIFPKKIVVHPSDIIKSEEIKIECEESSQNSIIDLDKNHSNDNIDVNNFFNNKVDTCKSFGNAKKRKENCNIKLDVNNISNKSSKNINIEVNVSECNVDNVNDSMKNNVSVEDNSTSKNNSVSGGHLLELKDIVNEDSNISDTSSVGNISLGSSIGVPNIEYNANNILNYIDKHTEERQRQNLEPQTTIMTVDGSFVTIRGNPDQFHLATPEILKDLQPRDQKKLLIHQAYIDWKYCLQKDEDDNLPIHLAVINNDLPLLKRQCFVLKSRNESVDIPAAGNLTALQISLFQDCPECTAALLSHGADILVRDDEGRTTLHLAAEVDHRQVEALITHCKNNARQIVKEDESFWKPELDNTPDTVVTQYLLDKICTLYDNQGYTPLLLASKLGNAETVQLLVAASPCTINVAMPTSGNSALYEAVAAACIDATSRGDKTKVIDNYERTIEILVENGADPYMTNNSGSSVIDLLTEFNIVQLSMIIGNNISSVKYFEGRKLKKFDSYMLVKDDKGKVKIEELNMRSQVQDRKQKEVAKTQKGVAKTQKEVAKTQKEEDAKVEKSSDVCKRVDVTNVNQETKKALTVRVNRTVYPEKGPNNAIVKVPKSQLSKPVILRNVPVITQLVSFDNSKKKKFLAKDIVTNPQANSAGLLTKIVAKPVTPRKQAVIRSDETVANSNLYKIVIKEPKNEKNDIKSLAIDSKSVRVASKQDPDVNNVKTSKRKCNILKVRPVKKMKISDLSQPSSSKQSK